jgi:hypothetical protein
MTDLERLLQDIRKNIATVSADGGYWAARIDNVLKGKK